MTARRIVVAISTAFAIVAASAAVMYVLGDLLHLAAHPFAMFIATAGASLGGWG